MFSDIIKYSEPPQKKKLQKVIDRCTRFDPNLRYQNIKEVEMDLQAVFEQSRQRILFRVWVVVLILLMLGLGELALQPPADKADTGKRRSAGISEQGRGRAG